MTVPPSLGDWDGSLGAAEQALRAAAERLMAGDESVQAEFDKWDKRIAGARRTRAALPFSLTAFSFIWIIPDFPVGTKSAQNDSTALV
jgi:hypothetical protein